MSDPARNLRRVLLAIGVLAAGGGLLAPGCDDSGHGPTDAGSVPDGDGRIIVGTDGPIGKPTDAKDEDAPRSDAVIPKDGTAADTTSDLAAKDVMPDAVPALCDIVKQDCPGMHKACYPDNQGKPACGTSLEGPGGSPCSLDEQCGAGFLCGVEHNGAGLCLPICRLPDTPCRNNIACIAVAGLGAGYCEQF